MAYQVVGEGPIDVVLLTVGPTTSWALKALGITVVTHETMKTAISIPDELFVAAERTAKRLGLSRSELYRRAVAAFLQRHSDEVVTESLNAVYADQDSRVDPSLLRAQLESLGQEEW